MKTCPVCKKSSRIIKTSHPEFIEEIISLFEYGGELNYDTDDWCAYYDKGAVTEIKCSDCGYKYPGTTIEAAWDRMIEKEKTP
jgi:C4-type Zn-finger protein